MASASPLISVVLPLYNGELYIEEAINSILNQTFKDFELLIINDGSKDRSAEIVKNMSDERIILISQKNTGMAGALNHGLSIAKGQLIARQDADDISHPDRFQKQVDFLKNNPDCALVGTWARIFSDKGSKSRFHQHPTGNLTLKLLLLFNNPFVHSSLMIKKSALDEVGYFDTFKDQLIQDYELWSRIAAKFEIANIPEVLQDYREVSTSISRTTSSFSEKVMEQSIDNLIAVSGKKTETVKSIAYLAHGAFKKINRNISPVILEKEFREITDTILLKNKGDLNSFNAMKENYLRSFLEKINWLKIFGPGIFTLYNSYRRLKNIIIKK
jgi:glycosyltransferase involved in cell wall biosynthesis